uniref:Uncharacterized protein n=1 Tax=Oryza glumipatula TaxID=40148 RepID=A0A0E0BL20_9ORYZ
MWRASLGCPSAASSNIAELAACARGSEGEGGRRGRLRAGDQEEEVAVCALVYVSGKDLVRRRDVQTPSPSPSSFSLLPMAELARRQAQQGRWRQLSFPSTSPPSFLISRGLKRSRRPRRAPTAKERLRAEEVGEEEGDAREGVVEGVEEVAEVREHAADNGSLADGGDNARDLSELVRARTSGGASRRKAEAGDAALLSMPTHPDLLAQFTVDTALAGKSVAVVGTRTTLPLSSSIRLTRTFSPSSPLTPPLPEVRPSGRYEDAAALAVVDPTHQTSSPSSPSTLPSPEVRRGGRVEVDATLAGSLRRWSG